MKRAIVLSGGGARGAYQFGAWKALKKMRIKYDIVTGTSIGALNGCLMLQNDFKKAKKMWENLNYADVLDRDINIDMNTLKGKTDLFKTYLSAVILRGGMDVKNLETTVMSAIDVKKFYKSKKDFGLITVKLNDLKPLVLIKKEIPEDMLMEYLLASATCYPIFKQREINSQEYIDGGYYDNLPINLAIDLGAEEVIAIDLNALGVTKKIKNENINVKVITPQNKIGSFVAFDAELSRRSIRLGYNDTMKAFNKLKGKLYTFKHFHLEFNLWWNLGKFKKNIESFTNNTLLNVYEKRVIPKNGDDYKEFMNDNLEYLGQVLDIDDSYIYGIFNYHKQLLKGINKIDMVTRKSLEEKIKNGDFKQIFSRQLLLRYLYDKMFTQDKPRVKSDLAGLAVIFPKEFVGALYLYTIGKH